MILVMLWLISLKCIHLRIQAQGVVNQYLPQWDPTGGPFQLYPFCGSVIKDVCSEWCLLIHRQRSALGECLAAFSGAFPVAFLETHLNKHNIYSIYNTKNARDRAGISRNSHHGYENMLSL